MQIPLIEIGNKLECAGTRLRVTAVGPKAGLLMREVQVCYPDWEGVQDESWYPVHWLIEGGWRKVEK